MKQFFGNSSSGYRLAVRTILLVLISALTALSTSLAQDTERAATEERLNDLRHQIEQDQRRLAETTEAEQATLSTLETLDREISLRQELLETYRRHIREIESESDSLRSSMAALERDLNELREQYQSRVRHAYMYGRMHDLALILSASSINQMLVRARYLNRFSAQRRERLEKNQKDDSGFGGARPRARREFESKRGVIARDRARTAQPDPTPVEPAPGGQSASWSTYGHPGRTRAQARLRS